MMETNINWVFVETVTLNKLVYYNWNHVIDALNINDFMLSNDIRQQLCC